MAELEVPDESLAVLRQLSKVHATEPIVRAIAGPVVIAELRELAADMRRLRTTSDDPSVRNTYENVSLLLDDRADRREAACRKPS